MSTIIIKNIEVDYSDDQELRDEEERYERKLKNKQSMKHIVSS